MRILLPFVTDQEIEQLETLPDRMEEAPEEGDVSILMEINIQFDSSIYASSRRPLLYEQAVWSMRAADRYRRFHFGVEEQAMEAIDENWEMLEPLRSRDPEAVGKLTHSRLQRSASALRELIGSQSA